MLRNHTPDKDIQLQQMIIHLKSELAKYQSMLIPDFEKEHRERIQDIDEQNQEMIRKNDTLRKKLALLTEENLRQRSYMYTMQDSLCRIDSRKNPVDVLIIQEDKDLINSLWGRIYELEVTYWEMYCKAEDLYKENEHLKALKTKSNLNRELQTPNEEVYSGERRDLHKENRILQEELHRAARYKAAAESSMEELRKEIKAYNEGNMVYPRGTENNEETNKLNYFISEFEKKDEELEKALKLLRQLEKKISLIENKVNND
ncbi:hypothetical protein [Cytobacillus firmus]|uniref:Uncharacterized protein n=1 Tax=Cytobacillus firmus DS1 TaxID=1307436 RepID=W7KVM1_CYTFI|nr:hypothetical protein [Cytobacillus firmus]EWG10248.1 hypothetical protein PBF_14134 [Cytobacillus firmus DS1]